MGKASRKKLQPPETILSENYQRKDVARTSVISRIRSKMVVHIFLVVIVGLIAYSNTFQVPFAFDDTNSIVKNPVITSLDNFLSSSQGYTYNPRRVVGYFSFALNYYFGELEVTGYHVVNLAIHIINALLIYALVILTFKTPYMWSLPNHDSPSEKGGGEGGLIALFSALLFVAHPIQTQAVTYVVQRLTSLATMFYLISVVMYVKGRIMIQNAEVAAEKTGLSTTGPSIFYFISSVIAAVIAMKTKEIAFTLPIIIILYDFTFFGSSLKKKLLFLLPLLLTLAIVPISLVETGKPLGDLLSDLAEGTKVQTDIPRWDYLMTQLRVITTYIRLLFFPAGQNLDYDYPIYHSLFTPSVFLSFLFLTSIFGLTAYLLYKARAGSTIPYASYYRLIGFGGVWFFFTLSVESSIIPIVDVIFEHRLYLPSVGAFTAITASLFFVKDRLKYKLPQIRTAFLPAFFVLIIVLAGTTYARNIIWRDGITLWNDVVQKSPFKARAYDSRGLSFFEMGQRNNAITDFNKAIALNPNWYEPYINRGFTYSEMGQLEKALEDFDKAITACPRCAQAYNNKGMIYGKAGLLDKAIEQFSRALDIMPDSLIYANRGLAYYRLGENERALEDLNKAIALDKNYAEAYGTRGNVYFRTGNKEFAISDFQKACLLGSDEGCKVLQTLQR